MDELAAKDPEIEFDIQDIYILYSVAKVLHQRDSLDEVVNIFPEVLGENLALRDTIILLSLYDGDSGMYNVVSSWGIFNRWGLDFFTDYVNHRLMKRESKSMELIDKIVIDSKEYIVYNYFFSIDENFKGNITFLVSSTFVGEFDEDKLTIANVAIDDFIVTLEHRYYKEILEQRLNTLYIISEVSKAIFETIDISEIASIMLVAITSGKGLGFNRAFILLYDREKRALNGYLGVGPYDEKEAEEIWSRIERENPSFEDMIRSYKHFNFFSSKIMDIVRNMNFNIDKEQEESLKKSRFFHIIKGKCVSCVEWMRDHIARIINNDTFIVVPLVFREKLLGILIVDNFITGDDPSKQRIEFLVTLSQYLSMALDNSMLVDMLEKERIELEKMYEELKVHRAKSIEYERLLAMGSLVEDIADKIRNPIVSIGGLAKVLLKKEIPKDLKDVISLISKKAIEVELILKEVLSFSGHIDFTFRKSSLSSVIKSSIKYVKAEILPKKDLEIVFNEIEPVEDFFMDPDKLSLVFVSILKQIVYSVSGDETIEVKLYKTGEAKNIATVEFKEPKLSIKYMENMFKAFFEYTAYDLKVDFAIVGNIIKKHNGSIALSEDLSGRMSFLVNLPIRTELDKINSNDNG